nr:hypothetical protein Iba_chr12cCG12750 [Ipomoea batatas]GMD68370.1 hypothetical protein Iba_chr12dCG8520 [Ipomoea batatas]GMD70639.1 hypothetical protein Iba_chr12eCG8260 [Ipomoea batatas]
MTNIPAHFYKLHGVLMCSNKSSEVHTRFKKLPIDQTLRKGSDRLLQDFQDCCCCENCAGIKRDFHPNCNSKMLFPRLKLDDTHVAQQLIYGFHPAVAILHESELKQVVHTRNYQREDDD